MTKKKSISNLILSYWDGNVLNKVRRASNESIKQNVNKSSSCVDVKGYNKFELNNYLSKKYSYCLSFIVT